MRSRLKKCTNRRRKDSHFLFKSIVDSELLLHYNSVVISSGPEKPVPILRKQVNRNMSASQDKKKRTQQRAEGTERRQVAAQKQNAEKKKERIRWTLGGILIALLIIGILVGNSSLFYRQGALKVGDETFSAAQVNYYANTAYQNWYSQYGSMLQYMVEDPNQPIKTQKCTMSDEYETWGDYFIGTAKESMKQIVAMSEAAKAEGMSLTEEELSSIDEQIEQIKSNAKTAGFGSGAKYLQALFGQGATESIVRQEMQRSMLASDYATAKQESFTYTDEELAAEYKEHANDYDLFSGMYYFVAADTVEVEAEEEGAEPTQETTEETMAAAKKTADEIAKAVAEADAKDKADAFKKAVAELGEPVAETDSEGNETGETTPAEPQVMENVAGSSLSYQGFAEWMMDAGRKANDSTVYEQENGGYYVVLFQGRETEEYNTVNVRHILVKPVDADGDSAISDDEKAAAEARMDEIKAKWEAGEQTEDAFAALANEFSEDPGSNSNGGLYENVYKNQMVSEFNDFCFADGRKAGDVDVVYNENTGYHLIFFVGEGMPYTNYVAQNLLRSEDFSAWQKEFMADWEDAVTELRGMKYVD